MPRIRGWVAAIAAGALLALAYVTAERADRQSDSARESGRSPAAGDNNRQPDNWSCRRCNLVLINIDLLRADYVGLLGSARGLTPNIDRFFRNAVIFTDTSSPSGATYLSATAVATGTEAMFNTHSLWDLRPGGGSWKITRIIAEDGRLPVDRMPTLAQVLSAAGYRTIAVNDWIHSGDRVLLDRGFADYVQLPVMGSLFADQVDAVLDKLREATAGPYLLYFHSNALHFNFFFPLDYFADRPDLQGRVGDAAELWKGNLVVRARSGRLEPDEVWSVYAEQVKYVDRELARLSSELERPAGRDTIVVLYSNHGTDMDGRSRMVVGLPYREYLHVPLLIRHPALDRPVRIDSTTSLVDLMPTLLDLIGIHPSHRLTTVSMMPLLRGEANRRQYVLSRDFQHESIRKGEWKLIKSAGHGKALYNLHEDPGERVNLYGSRSAVARELESALRRMHLEQIDYVHEMETVLGVTVARPANITQ